MKIKLHKDDYVLLRKGEPAEALDVIYHHSSVIELFNDGFRLEDDEAFVSMTEIPIELHEQYIKAINL